MSAGEQHREFIGAQVALGRNAVSIGQVLVEGHGVGHAYNSVKRYVRGLEAREPERHDVLEHRPGEEAQVLGALFSRLTPKGSTWKSFEAQDNDFETSVP